MPGDEPDKPAIRVIAYITSWCPDCIRSRRCLQRAGIPCVEIDIERVASAENAMRALNGDSGKVPTLLIESEYRRDILVEPSDSELTSVLRQHRQEVESKESSPSA